MRDIILKNSEWMRGKKPASLLDGDRQDAGLSCRCCLGVLAKDFGVKDSEMMGARSFADSEFIGEIPLQDWLITDDGYDNSTQACLLMGINDDSHIVSDKARVNDLNSIANEHGINFIYREDL